jgi:hypothetical protein
MRSITRATLMALGVSLSLATAVMAKGEQASAVIGPIADMDAGTPTEVTASLSMAGQPITDPSFAAVLEFYDPATNVVMDFPLRYRANGTWVATVTLPSEGRWIVGAVMRHANDGYAEPFGTTNGTRGVTVNPAATAPTAPAVQETSSPLGAASLGAAAASAVWLLGLGVYLLRRRRLASVAQRSVGERLPA